MLEIPAIWKAVEVVEAALFSGLLWREPADPRPGHAVEALIASTGLRFGAYWNEHKCGPECVRSRPISKRFRKTVEAWASESLQPEIAKELCDANEA